MTPIYARSNTLECFLILYLSFLSVPFHSAYRSEESSSKDCPISGHKVDCHPDPNANQSECLRRNCCWQNSSSSSSDNLIGEPNCFFPANFDCYDIIPIEEPPDQPEEEDPRVAKHFKICPRNDQYLRWSLLRRADCPASGFLDDAKQLEVKITVYDFLLNVRIFEPEKQRFEPDLPEIKLPKFWKSRQSARFYDDKEILWLRTKYILASILKDPNSPAILLTVISPTGVILFEADLSKLIYSRQFIQLSTSIPPSFVYGLGQHKGESLNKSPDKGYYAKTYTMFNYGHSPEADGRTSYSSYPFYISLAQLHDGLESFKHPLGSFPARKLLATGVLMRNTNAMDISLHSSRRLNNSCGAITWRLVGGIVDLYMFVGPQPHDVIDQYQNLFGAPALPPNWALGYHQSRYNYRDLLSIKLAWARTRSSGIPVESIWTDIEFLWRGTSYTLNNLELNQLVKILQDEFGMHYVAVVDPAISIAEELDSYEPLRLARSMNLFATIKHNRESKENSTAFVTTWTESKKSGVLDFTNPRVVEYLEQVLSKYKKELNFDGLWLDMNEPEVFANEQMNCPLDEDLSYNPGNRPLNDKTLCMSAQFQAGRHQDIHNIYAFYQSKAHFEALKRINPTKRPFIISRSQFLGQGKFSGTWLGDLKSNFDHMRWSLLGTIENNWFGQPLVGGDICGFFGATTDELCSRWFSLGAFYTLSRNHNDGSSPDQDPGALGEVVQKAARIAIMKRYSLLPYLFSLFLENYLKHKPVIRSVVFEFFEDYLYKTDLDDLPQINDQFMWGSAIMFAPVLESNTEFRSVYLPRGRWYDVSIGLPGTNLEEGPYDALKSNWPSNHSDYKLDGIALKRLRKIRRAIDCEEENGCTYENQYTPLSAINIYLRGGRIVPTFGLFEHTKSVGMLWNETPIFLEVALDQTGWALGYLYWDNGESKPEEQLYDYWDFWAQNNELVVTAMKTNSSIPVKFSGFVVYGLKNIKQAPESYIYRNAKLNYALDTETGTLSCLFYDPELNKPNYMYVDRFEYLKFKW